jgi:hypothetical protein
MKQVAGSPHEREGILPYCVVLERQALSLATRVVPLNPLHY